MHDEFKLVQFIRNTLGTHELGAGVHDEFKLVQFKLVQFRLTSTELKLVQTGLNNDEFKLVQFRLTSTELN